MAPSSISPDPRSSVEGNGKIIKYPTPLSVRLATRSGELQSTTASLVPGFLQANLIILPCHHAPSFLLLCQRNPVPCLLLAYTPPGDPTTLISNIPNLPGHILASDIDLSTDAPFYMVYDQGRLDRGGIERGKGDEKEEGKGERTGKGRVSDVKREWGYDYVGFLIGCSFGFEGALEAEGLVPRHWGTGRTVPMYRSNVSLNPAGVFTDSTYVVPMRPYKASDIERVRDITRPYTLCHGEPISWGWDGMKRLGIEDLEKPQWGDAPGLIQSNEHVLEGEELVPMFWSCGVTPQEAVMKAGEKIEGVVMAHEPGHMIILDVKNSDLMGFDGI